MAHDSIGKHIVDELIDIIIVEEDAKSKEQSLIECLGALHFCLQRYKQGYIYALKLLKPIYSFMKKQRKDNARNSYLQCIKALVFHSLLLNKDVLITSKMFDAHLKNVNQNISFILADCAKCGLINSSDDVQDHGAHLTENSDESCLFGAIVVNICECVNTVLQTWKEREGFDGKNGGDMWGV